MARSRQRGRGSVTKLTGASGVAKVVRDNWKIVRGQAGEQATAITRSLREHGRSVLNDEKARAAEEIQNLGAVVRRAADQLHDRHSPALATYVDRAAQRIDSVAEYVEDLDLTTLAREAGQFARRRPALVVGGMFLAGLTVARFIKAGQSSSSSITRSSSSSSSSSARRRRRS